MKSIKCPKCGKMTTVTPGEQAICSYCGEKIFLEKELDTNCDMADDEEISNKCNVISKIKSINKKIIAFCIYAIIITILFLYSNFALNDLKEELDSKKSAYNTLDNLYESLYSDYKVLENQNNELEYKLLNYEDQQEKIDDLTQQLSELQTQYDELKSENESLKSQLPSGQSNNSSSGGMLPLTDSEDSSGGMVWLSETGSKYHSIPNCGRMNPNKARQVTQSSAEASGYDRCSKCF